MGAQFRDFPFVLDCPIFQPRSVQFHHVDQGISLRRAGFSPDIQHHIRGIAHIGKIRKPLIGCPVPEGNPSAPAEIICKIRRLPAVVGTDHKKGRPIQFRFFGNRVCPLCIDRTADVDAADAVLFDPFQLAFQVKIPAEGEQDV